jgi:hypothetical protein
MEDNLNILVNGRQSQFLFKKENDLNIFGMKEDLLK